MSQNVTRILFLLVLFFTYYVWVILGEKLKISYKKINPIHYDLVIKNGLIYDGSGELPFKGDIGIIDDKIQYVGKSVYMVSDKTIFLSLIGEGIFLLINSTKYSTRFSEVG